MKVTTSILFSFLFFISSLRTQVELINPIYETGPMNEQQMAFYKAASRWKNWGIEKMGIDSLIYEGYTGDSITICICDTGRPTHKLLADKIKLSKNFSSDTTDIDLQGHSTHVMGIMAEMVPDAEYLISKPLNKNGQGDFFSVALAIDWCRLMDADIINLSLGGPVPNLDMLQAVQAAVRDGVIIVAAAGNSGQDSTANKIIYPARFKEVLAIGSINKFLKPSWFSSGGPDGNVVAPGEKILSTWLNDNFRELSGTSMASPFVTSMIALLLEKHHRPKDIKNFINTKVVDILPEGYDNSTFNGHPHADSFYSADTRKELPPPIDDNPGQDPKPDPVPGKKRNGLKIAAIGLFVATCLYVIFKIAEK